jgi:hypothetical protein
MRRIWTGTAAAAAIATAFATPVAFAQEQGKQPPAGVESGQHRETGQGKIGAAQPGARAETDQSRMGAEPTQDQNRREREQANKPAMKGESAQTQEPANRPQPGKMDQGGKTGSQAQERRAEQTGPASHAGQSDAGAQNRQGAAQTGENGKQMTGRNVQATGKTNLPHDKAARVAQTLMAGGAARNSQNINVDVSVGAALPADVVVNPLPVTIVDFVPEFRGYDYFVMGDEIVIVDPVTRQVVEIIEDVG